MLLIFPPTAKACEPPAGIARLAGALQTHNIPCRLWDANLEGQLWLLEQQPEANDTWTTRAWRSRHKHLQELREPTTCANSSRYTTAVNDLNRLLLMAAKPLQAEVGLADYRQSDLSPVRSKDLLQAAARPELNPFFPFFQQRLPGLLDGMTTVGISLNFLSQALCSFSLIGLIRQQYPNVKIALGGGLVTTWLSRPDWQNPFGDLIDHLIAGPGERPLLELLGQNTSQSGNMPGYQQLPLQQYLSPGLILPYSAASGCWWNRCSFCPERAEGNRYLPLPTSQVLAELQQLVQQYRPTLLHLLDNALSPALLQGMIEQPPGVPWYGFVRFEQQLEDPAFCHALRQSGCVMLKLGIESGDQAVLDRLHKGIRLEQAGLILENLRQAGIAVYGYLLFGTPAEDQEAARRTLAFVQQHHAAISFLNLAVFNMPLFGDEVPEYETELFYEGDLSLYTGFKHPKGWGRGEVRRFLCQEFSRPPEIAAIIRRDPPQFTSNHAALFC
ncbi:MAG: radical SAM protein [Geobacteraceae bacterium]|nr:radical SAM protein [Geobacteraceae bacterium]